MNKYIHDTLELKLSNEGMESRFNRLRLKFKDFTAEVNQANLAQ